MAKCIRCGKSTALRGHVKIKDADLCGVCFKELGFERNDVLTASLYKYDEIKDGRDAYYRNRYQSKMVDDVIKANPIKIVGGSSSHPDLNETEEERQIYETILSTLSAAGKDTSCMKLVRKSNDYVSACMESSQGYGDMDVARFKFTARAKWIKTGEGFKKYEISSPNEVQQLSEELLYQYRFNEPYL